MSKTNKKINWRVNVLSYNESSQFCQMTWRIPCAFHWLLQGETFQYECHAGWRGQGWKRQFGPAYCSTRCTFNRRTKGKKGTERQGHTIQRRWLTEWVELGHTWKYLPLGLGYEQPLLFVVHRTSQKNKNQRKKPPKRRNCSQSTLSYDVWTSPCSILI